MTVFSSASLRNADVKPTDMKGEHNCELLINEDRFDASSDFVEEQGYEYYDMNREYEKTVRACVC